MKKIETGYNLELLGLILGAALTRLIGLWSPKGTIFDEVYFKQYPAYYFSHAYYFDIHPPLGKLLIAGWMWLIRADPTSVVNGTPTAVRFFIALFGVAIVPLTYGILIRLTSSRLTATLGGLIIMLNGVLIVESRFVLMDSMLICFGLAAIYTALRWYDDRKLVWLIASGILTGATISIKWTGLTAAMLVFLILIKAYIKHRPLWIREVGNLCLGLLLIILIYLGSFWVHLHLLNKSGTGDNFMPVDFQTTLVGNPLYKQSAHLSFWYKTIELNKAMYEASSSLKATSPNSSKWYVWPLETKPIYYAEGNVLPDGRQGNVYLISNPLVWWLSSLSVIAALVIIIVPKIRYRFKKVVPVLCFLLVAYLINWLPFAKIARVMFLYHYLFALIFSTMIMSILLGSIVQNKHSWKRSPGFYITTAVVAITIVGFIFVAPFNYGWPLSPHQIQEHMFFPSWR